MNDVTDVLVKARNLISEPERWTQNHSARNAFGDWTDTLSAEAVCWCAVGAIARVAPDKESWNGAIAQLKIETKPLSVGDFNDTHTHAEVLAAFDKAIAESKS